MNSQTKNIPKQPQSPFSLPHQVESIPISKLKPYPRNARTHSRAQLGQIKSSIETFGFTNPVLIDAKHTIIAGHGRVEAAKMVGMTEVPTLCLEHLTEAEVRAYILADNKLAENAGWDPEILAIELQWLLEADLNFEVEVTGFEMGEIDLILGAVGDEPDEADQFTPPDSKHTPVSKLGVLWQLGDHRLLCGNALDKAAYQTLMGKEKAEMVFTDPPYNVPIQGHVSGKGGVQHREFPMASGEMSKEDFTDFLYKALSEAAGHTKEGSIHFVCMDWRHMEELLAAGNQAFTELKNLCVWNKTNAGMGSFYRSKHELVFVFKKGNDKHINNFGLGDKGRYRSNVWDYPGASGLAGSREESIELHPTVKPVAMVADALLDCSKRKGLVLDPFGGSGTMLLAAERTGRKARVMELDPLYVDTAIRRWEQWTGLEAVHMETGHSFKQIAQQAAINSSRED